MPELILPHKLTSMLRQVQGRVFDQRRKLRFSDVSNSIAEECERLGLWKTRAPRFTQLFFYNFFEHEATLGLGQASSLAASRRAAKTYLTSGARLESKCGLSDVWFHYVETHRHLFEPLSTQPPSESKPHLSNPRLDVQYAPAIYDVFEWYKYHKRPRPTKKDRVLAPSTPLSEILSSEDGVSDDDEARPNRTSETDEDQSDCSGTSSDEEEGGESEESQTPSMGSGFEEGGSELGDDEDGSLVDRNERVDGASEDSMDTSDNDEPDGVEDVESEGSEGGGESEGSRSPAMMSSASEENISEDSGHMSGSSIGRNERVDGASDDGMDTSNDNEQDGVGDAFTAFEPWSASFEAALVHSLACYEDREAAPPMPANDMFVPSSIPEEQELHIGSKPLYINGSTEGLGHVTGEKIVQSEDEMEGIELTQSTEGQITGVSDGDKEEASEDGDKEEASEDGDKEEASEDGEHPGNSK